MKSILITGGTGLIGTKLYKFLKEKHFNVIVLTRRESLSIENKDFVLWDPEKNILDTNKIENIDCVINLAGESIDGSRWTNKYKKRIMDSRVISTRFLFTKLKSLKNKPKVLVSASAVGCYHEDTLNEQDETSDLNHNFLGDVVKKWEFESRKFEDIGIKTSILRIGVVLSKEGGMLRKLYPLFLLGLGVPIGSGKQILSWVHIDDMVAIIFKCINENLSGIFNIVAPEKINNIDFTKLLSKRISFIRLPSFIKAPKFLVRIIFGEQSTLVLNGLNISSKKIEKIGYVFKFPTMDGALKNIYNK
tara:strand:+ start:2252 stop:3163 length:912 start_codon:yes stop_codon:yes gene_type:complete